MRRTIPDYSYEAELDHDQLREALHYSRKTGDFTWRERDVTMFKGDQQLCTTWNDRFACRVAGAINKKGQIVITYRGQPYLAHRLAIFYVTGDWPSADVKHMDGKQADNRWCNLEECPFPAGARVRKRRAATIEGTLIQREAQIARRARERARAE
jgi:hypothetical protein